MDIYTDRIKPLFDSTGMSIKELAEEIGVPQKMIYNWNQGIAKSYTKLLPQIAAYFHVSVDYLTGASDEKSPPQGDGLSAEQREIMDLYDSLSPADRAALLATAKALAAVRKSQGDR